MNLVYQPNLKGCFAACCATLFGGSYEEWDCVGHHHSDWREKLKEKTGLEVIEVDCTSGRMSVQKGNIYILGVGLIEGSGHAVLGRCMHSDIGKPIAFDIFHDPLGSFKSEYQIDSILLLAKVFS